MRIINYTSLLKRLVMGSAIELVEMSRVPGGKVSQILPSGAW